MEISDGYLADGSPAGVDLVRGRPIPLGLLHPVIEVMVQHRDGEYLLMRRALEKPGFPGLWEAGASGSVLKGESFEQGARRELWEETGIRADRITELARRAYPEEQLYFVSYYCPYEGDKEAIRLQPGETMDFCWAGREALLAFMAGDQFVAPQAARVREHLARLDGA